MIFDKKGPLLDEPAFGPRPLGRQNPDRPNRGWNSSIAAPQRTPLPYGRVDFQEVLADVDADALAGDPAPSSLLHPAVQVPGPIQLGMFEQGRSRAGAPHRGPEMSERAPARRPLDRGAGRADTSLIQGMGARPYRYLPELDQRPHVRHPHAGRAVLGSRWAMFVVTTGDRAHPGGIIAARSIAVGSGAGCTPAGYSCFSESSLSISLYLR